MGHSFCRVCHRLPIPTNRWSTCPIDFPVSKFCGISMVHSLSVFQPPAAFISHRFPMTRSMGNLWDISVLIMTTKNHSMFTHCILRIVLSAMTKYIPVENSYYTAFIILASDNFVTKMSIPSLRIFDMRELNSNTLKCCSKKQKLNENFIQFLLTYSHYVLIQALSFMKCKNIQMSQFVK